MQIYLVMGLVFSLLIAVFAVQNATRVDITLLLWQLKNMSLVLVIFASALIGAIAAALFGAVKQIKLTINIKNYKSKIESQEMEIEYLQRKLGKTEATEEWGTCKQNQNQ